VDAYIARQPIFDARRGTYGYELLFRSGPVNAFPNVDGTYATRRVMHDGMHLFGFDKLTSGKPAFVNFTRQALLDDILHTLPPDQVVIEILETVTPDREVLRACKMLKNDGYVLALDDFVLRPGFEPLLALADMVKIDFRATQGDERRIVAGRCSKYGARLIAEKVETGEEFAEAVGFGYTLFQGYFFSKPEMLSAKELPSIKLQYLRLLAAVNAHEIDVNAVESIVKHDVSIAVKLLRYLRSAALGGRHEVRSVRHALVMLGERPLRRWVSLLAVASLGNGTPEVVTTSLVRARFAELAATASTTLEADPSSAFLAGLLSLVDVLLGRPLPDCLDLIGISAEVRAALLDGMGVLAPILRMTMAYERGEWAIATTEARTAGVEDEDVRAAYGAAVTWANEVLADAA
jgi:EAL and modified HD-GYP domain-containing signal transduction protein